jgi:hypothetical protein
MLSTVYILREYLRQSPFSSVLLVIQYSRVLLYQTLQGNTVFLAPPILRTALLLFHELEALDLC